MSLRLGSLIVLIISTPVLGAACVVAPDGEALGEAEQAVTTYCGGLAGFSCPDGFKCVDDPSDTCDPLAGGADCIGFCEPAGETCGGIAGTPCPKGLVCVDDPSDTCDPLAGGADCIGFCEPAGETCSDLDGASCP